MAMNAEQFEKHLDSCSGNPDEIMAKINFSNPNFEILIQNFCEAILNEKIFFQDIRKQHDEEKNKRDDSDDDSDFMQMEYEMYWRSQHSRCCRDARKALITWWEINIDHLIKPVMTEVELENHDDSDCESDCENCAHRDYLRENRAKLAKENNYPNILTTLLKGAAVGRKFKFNNVLQFQVSGYIRDGAHIDETQKITLEFIKKIDKYGMLWNTNQTHCTIFYSDLPFWNTDEDYLPHGQLCLSPYIFTKRIVKKNDKYNTEVENSNGKAVHILYQDVVFEDYVHETLGFIIPNEEIAEYK